MTRLGYQIPNFSYPGVGAAELFDTIARQAREADASGFDTVLVMDHFYQLPFLGPHDAYMLECYSLLSALARETKSVRLSSLVTGNTYRNPAVLAKTITTLDIVSNGRGQLGIGAGWFELEHTAFGIEFGTFTDRFEKLEEALQIVVPMLRDEKVSLSGKHYTAVDIVNSPPPISRIPVMIGGGGERKTLRMVAQYGDACNVFGDAATVRRLMGVLDEHCASMGRNPADICRTRLGTLIVGRTMEEAQAKLSVRLGGATIDSLPADMQARVKGMFIVGDADEVGAKVQELLDAGLDGIVVNMPDAYDLDAVALAGDVLSKVFA